MNKYGTIIVDCLWTMGVLVVIVALVFGVVWLAANKHFAWLPVLDLAIAMIAILAIFLIHIAVKALRGGI